jgi:hypothetical protein
VQRDLLPVAHPLQHQEPQLAVIWSEHIASENREI